MKLLVITQAVDYDDPYVGFFHGWLVALSQKFESLEVICLKEGKHTLPSTVHVHSLGKEKKKESPLTYALRFLSRARKLHNSYDCVFVHMNPEYIVLAGLFWRLLGKKIYLWYNHPKGGVRLTLAMFFADKVFYTSPFAASSHSKKSVRMPAGIDTNIFSPQNVERAKNSIYLQGRVAPSKRVTVACEAVNLLVERGIPATLTIVGPEDVEYATQLRSRYKSLIEKGIITFLGPKPNKDTPALYSAHAVALNLASGGHYDKTVLEAAATGTPVIVAGQAFEGIVPKEWAGIDTSEKLVETLMRFFALSKDEQDALGYQERKMAVEQESLSILMKRLIEAVSTA